MKLNRKIVISFALAGAVMLSGCSAASAAVSSSVAASSAPASSVASSAAASSVAASSVAADSVAPAAYTPEELKAALDSCCDFEADSAGGSLKVTIAAANLVAFSAKYGESVSPMDSDAMEWYQGLSEDQLAALDHNWDLIHEDAVALSTDPASMTDKLSEAGVETDFSTMDLQYALSLANIMNSLLRQSW